MTVYRSFMSTLGTTYAQGASFKAALLTAAYTQSSAETVFADVSPVEISGGDYPAGGVALSGVVVVANGATVRFDCDDLVFTGLNHPSVGGVLFYRVSDGGLIAYDKYETPVDASAGGFTLNHTIDIDGFVLASGLTD